jgi:hypothetical protein
VCGPGPSKPEKPITWREKQEIAKVFGPDWEQRMLNPEPAVTYAAASNLLWLRFMYEQVKQQNIDGAIDTLFGHVDVMLSAGHFESCDRLLRRLDVQQLDANLIIAVLSATRRASAFLPSRPDFLERGKTQLREITERLISSLN